MIEIITFNQLKVSRIVDQDIYFDAENLGEIVLVANTDFTTEDQLEKIKQGRTFIVYVFTDEDSNQIAASLNLNSYIDKTPIEYKEGQQVELLIYARTSLGFKAIINNAHWGTLYTNEVFQPLHLGQKTTGYIKKVREDNLIDLILHKPGYAKVTTLTDRILNMLEENNGFIEVSDKSTPQLIYDMFGESKSTFKNAVGALYKKRLIQFKNGGIELCKKK